MPEHDAHQDPKTAGSHTKETRPDKKPMPMWKSALVGLAGGFGLVLATSPLGFYLALGRDDRPTGAFIAVGALWLAMLLLGTVIGAIAPGVLRSVGKPRTSPDESR